MVKSMPKKQTQMISPPRVAAVQMTSTPDWESNLRQVRGLLDQALAYNPNIVAFPENMLLLTDDSALTKKHALTPKSEDLDVLREWAAEADIWMLCGSLPFKATGGKIFNASLLLSPEGEIFARYDKIHLFDVTVAGDQTYKESKTVMPGKKPTVAKTPWGTFGLSICYDLRFPELYRKYADQNADAIFIPAAFTAKTGLAHWDILTRTRAVENQCYVIAPAQTGTVYPGRDCFGHTRIIDPWGRVIAERPAGQGVVWADLDYQAMLETRKNLPALEHRRL